MTHPGSTHCIVMTTTGTEDEAEALAAALVEARLAACVQVQRVRSFFRWEGALKSEPEWQLTIKTRSALYEAVEAFVRGHHSYAKPEIVQLPIDAGAADYLAWIDAGTADPTRT